MRTYRIVLRERSCAEIAQVRPAKPAAGAVDLRAERGDPFRSISLLAADKVAVSVEPAGGSPTGGPTGPIVIVTNVLAAG